MLSVYKKCGVSRISSSFKEMLNQNYPILITFTGTPVINFSLICPIYLYFCLVWFFCCWSGVMGSGLCVFSKWPILDVLFHKWQVNGYVHKVLHGDWYGGKGIGLCRLNVNGFKVNIYTCHVRLPYNIVYLVAMSQNRFLSYREKSLHWRWDVNSLVYKMPTIIENNVNPSRPMATEPIILKYLLVITELNL